MESENKMPKVSAFTKIRKFISQNKALSTGLIAALVLIIVIVYFNISISKQNKKSNELLSTTVERYETRIDSLRQVYMEQTVKVFAWVVRSELSRNNFEEINRYFLEFVQINKVDKVSLIDPISRLVLVSSDKKKEGTPALATVFSEIPSLQTRRSDKGLNIVVPIMGIERKVGILSVEIKL